MTSLPGMQSTQDPTYPPQNNAPDSSVAPLAHQEQQLHEQQETQQQQQQQQEVPQPQPDPQTQPQVRVVVQNVTASYSTLLKLDPSLIASKIKNAEYNAKKLPACVMKIREPQATGLLFQSGKLVVTGATGINAAHEAAGKFVKVLETLNLKPILGNATVQNIVATAEMDYSINIELMAYLNQRWSMYEPELFPGLIYQTPRRGVVAHVFCSGRVVLTGAKQEEHLNDALEHLLPVLEKFKDSNMGVIT